MRRRSALSRLAADPFVSVPPHAVPRCRLHRARVLYLDRRQLVRLPRLLRPAAADQPERPADQRGLRLHHHAAQAAARDAKPRLRRRWCSTRRARRFATSCSTHYKANRAGDAGRPGGAVPAGAPSRRGACGLRALTRPGRRGRRRHRHAGRRAWRRRASTAVIVTGDKDLMQLVGPRVRLWDTMRDRWIDVAGGRGERFGVAARAGGRRDGADGRPDRQHPGRQGHRREDGDGADPGASASSSSCSARLDEVAQAPTARRQEGRRARCGEHAATARLSRELASVRRDVAARLRARALCAYVRPTRPRCAPLFTRARLSEPAARAVASTRAVVTTRRRSRTAPRRPDGACAARAPRRLAGAGRGRCDAEPGGDDAGARAGACHGRRGPPVRLPLDARRSLPRCAALADAGASR